MNIDRYDVVICIHGCVGELAWVELQMKANKKHSRINADGCDECDVVICFQDRFQYWLNFLISFFSR